MRIAILSLQGAFAEHRQMLHLLGVETFEVRRLSDWLQPKDGLILPGGESTTQSRLMARLGLFDAIRRDIGQGLPVFGTCAGLILLSPMHLGTMDIDVRRNAYGRQTGSFNATAPVAGVGDDIPMTFIRAPYISRVLSPRCEVTATVGGHIVAARQGRQMVTAFHPELTSDTRMHRCFLEIVRGGEWRTES